MGLRASTWARLLVTGSVPLASFSAFAQEEDCEPTSATRGPTEVTPAAGAGNVTLGAAVRVRYPSGYVADDLGGEVPPDIVTLTDVDADTAVAGSIQVIGDEVLFVPAQAYAPRREYSGVALGLDFDLAFGFTTGASFDEENPVLEEIFEITSSKAKKSCDAPDGGYRVAVSFAPATDDGPLGDLEYLVHLTRGPGVVAPELRTRRRNFPTDIVTMAFILSPSEAVAPICVSVQAVDGAGRPSDELEPACLDPVTGNLFQPLCTVAAPWAGGRTGVAGLVIALAALAIIRRRARLRV